MDFIRVYITNDGNIPRGFTNTPEGKKPAQGTSYWFNVDTQMVFEKRGNESLVYDYSNIPGNETFRVYFFKNHFEVKTFDELIEKPVTVEPSVPEEPKKPIKKTRKTRTVKHHAV